MDHGFPGVDHRDWSGVFLRREVTPSEKVDPVKGAAEHNKEYVKPRRKVRLRPHSGQGERLVDGGNSRRS